MSMSIVTYSIKKGTLKRVAYSFDHLLYEIRNSFVNVYGTCLNGKCTEAAWLNSATFIMWKNIYFYVSDGGRFSS